MDAVLGVQVPPKGDHPERSELQLRKGDQSWEGSRERNRGPMNYFIDEADKITLFGVLHLHRNPDVWKQRR